MPTETLTTRELARLRELIDDFPACSRLNTWEVNFMEDLTQRVRDFGDKTIMSPKQWGIIDRIEEKVYAT